MKTALLPITLLALALPGPALAYPASVTYWMTPSQASALPAPGYAPPSYGVPAYRDYVSRPDYGPVAQPVKVVVRYANPTPVMYGGAPAYGAMPAAPYSTTYVYRAPTPYNVAPRPVYGLAMPPQPRACNLNPSRALVGAALGGLASAALAPRPRDRSWAVPVGAALGGLGGLATGC